MEKQKKERVPKVSLQNSYIQYSSDPDTHQHPGTILVSHDGSAGDTEILSAKVH
jgi:hypothetical protein